MNANRLLLSIVIILGLLIILTIGALIYGVAKKGETIARQGDHDLLERSNEQNATVLANIDIDLAPNETLLDVKTQHDKIILLIGDKKTHKIMVFSLKNAEKIAIFNLK